MRLLFVRTDRLGETLLTLPALHAARRAWPAAEIVMMVSLALRELLDGHPDLTQVMDEPAASGPWWRRAWRLSGDWRRRRFSAVVVANPKKEYHLAAWLAGIPQRVGYDQKWPWLLTHRCPPRAAGDQCHEIEANLALVQPLGAALDTPPVLRLPADEVAASRVRRRLHELGLSSDMLVAVHPWTSNPRKQWPMERFLDLIGRLAAVPSVQTVVIGGPEHEAACRQAVAPRLRTFRRAQELVGRLSLRETAELLRMSRVCVSNDSGPVHLAAVVGTPVVALFGTADPGSHPARWGPWGPGHTVLHQPLEQLAVEAVEAAVMAYVRSA